MDELWQGRLSSTTVTTTGDGGPIPLVRKSAFSYYSSGSQRGLLWKETIEPDQAAYTLVTEHSYDARGNLIKSKTSGGGATRCDAVTSTFDVRYRYVDTTRDCLGRTRSVVTSRNRYGAPTSIDNYVDTAASVTTHISYSVLGREYYRYTDDGSGQSSYLTANVSNCPVGAAHAAVTYLARCIEQAMLRRARSFDPQPDARLRRAVERTRH